ncbi:hypothetical protein ON010_g8631 [Phytophthora cinnamomi]|nr:hypothetical protein ON010_g8631 [Phytophthora cinnamomi]
MATLLSNAALIPVQKSPRGFSLLQPGAPAGLPRALGLQAHPAEQEVRLPVHGQGVHRPVRGARRLVPGGGQVHAGLEHHPGHRPAAHPPHPRRQDVPVRHHDGALPPDHQAGDAELAGRRGALRRRAQRGRRVLQGRVRAERAGARGAQAGGGRHGPRRHLRVQGLPLAGLQRAALGLQAALQEGERHQAAVLAQRVGRDLRGLRAVPGAALDRPQALRPQVRLRPGGRAGEGHHHLPPQVRRPQAPPRSVTQFIDAHDPIRLLTDTTKIKFLPEDDVYRDHKDTSDEIVTCLSDLKVLGKADFKNLLKWRTRMLKYKEELLKAEKPEEDEEEKPKEQEKEPEPARQRASQEEA